MLGGDIQHPVVDDGILVAREADIADFAGLLRLLKRLDGPVLGEAAVGILHAQVFVNLHEVDVIRLQPLERFIDLAGGCLPGAPVNLGHEEDLLPIPAIGQGLSH